MDKYKFIVNVEGCIIYDKKILMILRGNKESHAPNVLSFPGGKVETKDSDNSTLENSLRREIFEEVGLELPNDFEYLESKKFITKKGNKILDIIFVYQLKTLIDFKFNKEEVSDCMWMSADEILNDNRSPEWMKQSMKLVKQKFSL